MGLIVIPLFSFSLTSKANFHGRGRWMGRAAAGQVHVWVPMDAVLCPRIEADAAGRGVLC